MKAINARDDLNLITIATGMHLSQKYGKTVEQIRLDDFSVDETVEMLIDGDSTRSMVKSLGVGFLGFAETLESVRPDIVLVLGDRGEAFAAAVSAAHMNTPVAHIHGGDTLSGAVIDDSIRHALTKFAHLHFPASELSANRVRKLGEDNWRITTAGAPGIDDIRDGGFKSPETVRRQLGIDSSKDLIVVIQHPETTAEEQAGEQMEQTLDAVSQFDAEVVVIYPNSDAGGEEMIDVIRTHPVAEWAHTIENLPRDEYLGLLEGADVLVGNSSSGIIESPSLNVPVVNIGPRQEGRERAENVLDAPHDEERIHDAIAEVLTNPDFQRTAQECDNPYNKGGAGERIADRLANVEITDELLRKQLSFETHFDH